MSELFRGKTPCKDCPYRKDAPLAHWDITEFEKVLNSEANQFGSVFLCHKQDKSICKGFLMNQLERGMPNLALRLAMIKEQSPREYFDGLFCKSKMFETVEEMCEANFPRLKLR